MNLSQFIISKLWRGSLKRCFCYIARRLFPAQSRIIFGPMKGAFYQGPLVEMLGVYELDVQDAILDNLNEGGVFYDIGASNGYFTLLGARVVGTRGYVYAFEPLAINADKIKKVMTGNGMVNYAIIPQAVSNTKGEANFYIADGGDTMTPSLIQNKTSRVLKVNTITLDEFVQGYRWPQLVKIDVEGAELLVLKGALKLLSSDSPLVWIVELHNEENGRLVKELFESNGYHISSLRSPYSRPSWYPYHILTRRQSPK